MSAPRRTFIAVACLLLLAGAAAFAFRYAPGSRAAMPKPVMAVPVNVARVVLKTVPVRLRAIGNVEPFTTVAVKARIDGQIVAVHFKEGDEVRKGDTLFEIDRRPLQAQLQQAQANLLKDRALLDHANEQDKRYKDLLEKKFVSPDAYAQIRTNSETAAAQVSADQAAIESARLQLDYCTIRSPITGYAGKIQIQEGNLVKANDTISLVVINQVVPINASFSVPEQSLSAVRKYQADGELQVTAQVPNSGFAPVPGKLSFIDNTTDATTGTIKLKARVPEHRQGAVARTVRRRRPHAHPSGQRDRRAADGHPERTERPVRVHRQARRNGRHARRQGRAKRRRFRGRRIRSQARRYGGHGRTASARARNEGRDCRREGERMTDVR